MNQGVQHFLLRRIHSLTGIFPIGVFLLEHFYTSAKVQYGAEAFNQAEHGLWSLPYLWAAEIFLIAVPILFHGIYGLFITSEGDALDPAQAIQTRYHALAYTLQRLTGVVVFAFLLYHVWHTRIQWLLGGSEPDYAFMRIYFTPVGRKAFYVAGILCTCYHFANGLFNFAFKWGLTVSARSQERMVAVSVVIFLVLSAVGIHTLFSFR
jgi:succinate dehydrogenase / fumarate reductase cytochrome b subunit